MNFTFDPDKALAKRPSTPANPAKAANPEPQKAAISGISNISKPRDFTEAEWNELGRLLKELAVLEFWSAEELAAIMDERSRMAPTNVRKALAAIRIAHADALAPWPNPPAKRARITLCELTSRPRELVAIPGGKAEPRDQAKRLDSERKSA